MNKTSVDASTGISTTVPMTPEEIAEFQETVQPQDTRITATAFKRRLTQTERIAIRTLAETNAHVYDYMDLLNTSPSIHLDDEDVRAGIEMMENVELLAAGRATEILDAPIEAKERP